MKITHQAHQRVDDVDRWWSKWEDGSVTHNDSKPVDMPGGFIGTTYVNIGMDRDMRPPPWLNWIDTRGMCGEVKP